MSVFVSADTVPFGEEPICAQRLDRLSPPAWSTEIVRGTSGCAQETSTLSLLRWTDDGQDFVA